MCELRNLKILILQPFSNFEGWPKGSEKRKEAFEKAKGWIRIMEAAGTDMLQVGSTDSIGISDSAEDLAGDIAELADLLAEKGFRLAYENWCWSTHAPTWKAAWKIVQKTDRKNVGLCLDTFQIAGSEWADPTTLSGLIEGQIDLKNNFPRSLNDLSLLIPGDKIFYFQISDALKMDPPLPSEPDKHGLRPRGQWSHSHRPFPFNGGYLPVAEVTEAVLRTGFTGYVSLETFDERDVGVKDLEEEARKGMDSLEQLLNRATPCY